jgi:glycosyltransferase family protein
MKIIKNIKFLFRKKLKDEFNVIKSTQMDINDIMDNLKYELIDELNNTRVPKIMTVDETIDMLIKTNKSMARFGDGELNLMLGESIPMQKASPQLSNRLTEVFNSTDNGFCVAIVYALYHSKYNLTDINKHFWRYHGVKFRRAMEAFIDYDKLYGAAEMTLAYSYFKNYNYQAYFDKICQIWDKKDIVIVCGKTVFDKIETNIFDNAASIEYVYTPSIDAFEQYDSILHECLQKNVSKPFILICGPTAKVLAYDLMKNNRRALDLGHIAKQYDWFKKNKRTDKMVDVADFFSPD